ncbi:DUF4238 domain-containing protein [Caulobacter sp.]|uniref:DUF4238 domain-containing protein n=1 Tax=Caulobacter sp. TaxID=78 RepID=UPI003BB1B9AB
MPAEGPKKHHYVPQTYLRAFSDATGRLYSYRKDDPGNPHLTHIRNVAAENYYYAQPTPDGGRNLDALEKAFGEIESGWPEIVAILSKGQQLASSNLDTFYQFLGLMRVRGPASRDAIELTMAEQVRSLGRMLEKRGELPPKPASMEEALAFDNLQISIDPHQSLHMMPAVMVGFGKVLHVLGFSIIRNKTDISLLTSDNPVIYFDPSMPEATVRPYAIENGPPVELLFPLSPSLLLIGHSDWAGPKGHTYLRFVTCSDKQIIRRANRFIARFGYNSVFSPDRSSDKLIAKWAHESPISKTVTFPTSDGEITVSQTVFGQRPTKPKWRN